MKEKASSNRCRRLLTRRRGAADARSPIILSLTQLILTAVERQVTALTGDVDLRHRDGLVTGSEVVIDADYQSLDLAVGINYEGQHGTDYLPVRVIYRIANRRARHCARGGR